MPSTPIDVYSYDRCTKSIEELISAKKHQLIEMNYQLRPDSLNCLNHSRKFVKALENYNV